MKTIEQYIDAELNGKVKSKKNSPIPYLLILAFGIAFLALLRIARMDDTLMTCCLTVGFIATAVGFILTAMNLSGAMTHFVYLPTNSKMKDKKLYINSNEYSLVTDALKQKDLCSLATIHPVVSSNSALRILVSRDGVCALLQAGRYEGSRFEADTEPLLLSGDDALKIRDLTR